MEQGQRILLLARAVQATFTSSEWVEVAHLTDSTDWIHAHPRLLRSLYWGDDDYKGNVISAVQFILKKNSANLSRLLEYEPIAKWLAENDRVGLALLRAEVSGIPQPEFAPLSSSQVAQEALADAQSLLNSRGPASAIDRVHTGLHAFLRTVCSEAGLGYATDATPNQLLRLALSEHPNLKDLGSRADDVRKILRSAGAIVDSLGTLRNNASRAHPSDSVIDDEAALMAINVARSLLRYLDSKLSMNPPF